MEGIVGCGANVRHPQIVSFLGYVPEVNCEIGGARNRPTALWSGPGRCNSGQRMKNHLSSDSTVFWEHSNPDALQSLRGFGRVEKSPKGAFSSPIQAAEKDRG